MKKSSVLTLTLMPALFAIACGGGESPAPRPSAPSAAPAASGPATGNAVITGQINFEGTAPEPQAIEMSADPVCQKAHTDTVYGDNVVVNANGTLKDVFVYVKSGVEGHSYPMPSEPVVFDQTGCKYEPHVLGVRAGQTIKILNSDDTLHNVHALPTQNDQFNIAMPKFLKEKEVSFANEEVMIRVKCEVHPWMGAWVGVLSHPFFSVTDGDGAFSLENLPAGDYTIEAWHEKYGQQTQQVTLAADGTQEIAFTFAP